MRPIAVIVPGIMGSVIEYDRAGASVETLWGEDFDANYHRLVTQPGTLNWTGNAGKGRLLKSAKSFNVQFCGRSVSLHRVHLWDRVLNELSGHPSIHPCGPLEFGYDWRAPLEESAVHLRSRLEEAAESVGAALQDLKCVFVAHSMGGLLLRVGLGSGILIQRSSTASSTSARLLRALRRRFEDCLDRIDLPFFREVFRLFHWRNFPQFKENLLECMRTFPSLYYLLPPKEIDYLFYSVSSRSNPLRERAMHPDHKATANRAQHLLTKGRDVVNANGIKEYVICTSVNSKSLTDLEYRALPLGHGRGYSVEEVIGQTVKGDGTVSVESARGDITEQIPLTNVDHAFMCNDEVVAKALITLMPGSWR